MKEQPKELKLALRIYPIAGTTTAFCVRGLTADLNEDGAAEVVRRCNAYRAPAPSLTDREP